MDAVIIVALAAVVAAAIIVATSLTRRRRRSETVTPLDPDAAEHWLIHHSPRRLQPLMRSVDRRVAGGVVVAMSFLILLPAAFFVGWVLDTADEDAGFARWDEAAAEWGARHATDTSTRILEFITDLGGTRYLLILVTAVALIDVVRRRSLNVLAYLAVVLAGVVLVNNGLKLLVDRERPDIAQLVGWSGASFPSGHSAAAAAVWAAVALVVTRRQHHVGRVTGAIIAAAVAVGVAASRVLLGVHWLTDVIAGLIVGWTWFLLVSIAFGGRLLRLGDPADRIAKRGSSGSRTFEAATVRWQRPPRTRREVEMS